MTKAWVISHSTKASAGPFDTLPEAAKAAETLEPFWGPCEVVRSDPRVHRDVKPQNVIQRGRPKGSRNGTYRKPCTHRTMDDHTRTSLSGERLWKCSRCSTEAPWFDGWQYLGNIECTRCWRTEIKSVACPTCSGGLPADVEGALT